MRKRSSASSTDNASVTAEGELDDQRDELGTIEIRLDEVLQQRGLTLTALADAVDITLANLSILKTGKARAIRFSTLSAICQVLDCQPGDVLVHVARDE
jgi:putative transcriptional regulator